MLRSLATPAALMLTLFGGGCNFSDDNDDNADAATRDGQMAPAPAPSTPPQLSLEVDIASRQLNVYRSGQRVATHPVAVGSSEWPTPTGEWTISQVIWNPRWIPPQEEWAEDEEEEEPGSPDNPLGRAQLVYRAPNSIHGTSDTTSLGKAVSHGSIRVSNQIALDLARMATEAGGAPQTEEWYRQAVSNRTERKEVTLPNPIPIRVVAGPVAGGAADSARTGAGASTQRRDTAASRR